jgi:hypothetical protein
MSKQIIITITIPDDAFVVIGTRDSNIGNDWDIHEWSRRWQRDCKQWATDVLLNDNRTLNVLLRASHIHDTSYDYENRVFVSCEPYASGLSVEDIPYPEFYDALPMIANGIICISGIGDKSRKIIAGKLFNMEH